MVTKINKYSLALIILAVIVATACRKDFEYQVSSGNLEFSKDTVFLDTIFTNIGSATYTLKVYNRSNEDIRIPTIALENGQESSYRLNVDGLAGKEFEDIPLLAKDSMFIFVETTFDVTSTGQNEFLYTDAILFGSSTTTQQVELVTLVRDAIFLYPRTLADGMTETLLLGLDDDGNEVRIEGFILENDELTFTSEKPYVVYGYAAVPENNTLSIEAGARVHFHKNSGLLIGSGAAIQANGSLSTDQEVLENEIIFEGDRLEPAFSEEAGQWGTIWLRQGSTNNVLEYVTIKNATVGILAEGVGEETPTLTLRNSQVLNSSSINLWGRTATITAENLILGNAGEASLYGNLGGRYDFKHATIANYWSGGFRNAPSVILDNFVELQNDQLITEDLVFANFSNCIVDGNKAIELLLFENEASTFNFSFDHCLIRFDDTNNLYGDNPLFDFSNATLYQEVLLNGATDFTLPLQNNFQLEENSAAIDQADPLSAQMVPLDILGNDRTSSPDIGAYEYVAND